MKKVFITQNGQVSLDQTPEAVATAKMHCFHRHAEAAKFASRKATCLQDIRAMDYGEIEFTPEGVVGWYFTDVEILPRQSGAVKVEYFQTMNTKGRPRKTPGRKIGKKTVTLFEDQQVSADFVRAAVDFAMECGLTLDMKYRVVKSRVSDDGGPENFTVNGITL